MAKNNFGQVNIPPEIKGLKNNLTSIIIFGLLAIGLFSSWYTVGAEEAGVVLRLGKYKEAVGPGLRFKIPFGIDDVRKIPVERQLKQEFGYRTTSVTQRTRYSESNWSDESLMLTGDLNLAQVEWVVQYRINDPYKYLFKVREPEKSLRDMSESAMRQVIGDRTVDEVLTVGRREIASQVEVLLQKLCTEYENGIKIEQIVLQDVNPPDPVKPSFNGVNEAQQEREKLINQALADYNKTIPSARGKALETIQRAEGYALERVNRAQGEASRYDELYNEYVKAPEITKKRIYLETMSRILPNIGNKIIVDENGQNVLPLLNLPAAQQAVKGASK